MEMDEGGGSTSFSGCDMQSTNNFEQKKSRLDSFASRLAKSSHAKSTKDQGKKCPTCGSCHSDSASECSSCSASKKLCPVCGISVQPVVPFNTCSVCKKWVHVECDRCEAEFLDFCCVKCRKSPLVGGDAMLAMPPITSPLASGAGTSADAFDVDFSTRSSPATDSVGPLSFSVASASGVEGVDERMSGGSSMTSSDSARNSPAFNPDAASPGTDDDEFRPGRGNGSGRGGRGGKKKPGTRGNMKTRSGGKPPSGVFSDRLGKSDRGKRGKSRGSGKGGGVGTRGGSTRGRGRGGTSVSFPILGSLTNVPQSSSMLSLLSTRESDDTRSESGSRTRNDGEEYVRTIVICDENDAFLAHAPLCLVCGSVGRGQEQSMVACATCAHTYHTYCVGLQEKMNKSVVSRGWRCLDCTVCEGCGSGKDESKLLLCEECDVAYHMSCLNPPLERIPTGTWRCHLCAKCRRCEMKVPNGELTKEGLCQSCLSLRKCPKCTKLYALGEHIIKCSSCSRWYHGQCEDLHSEDQLESASINKMRCSFCRPNSRSSSSTTRESDGSLLLCDNVALNRCADEVLQSKMMPSLFRSNSLASSMDLGAAAFLAEYRSSSMDSHFGGSIDEESMGDDDFSMGHSSHTQSGMMLPISGPGSRGGRGAGRGGMGRGGRMHKLGMGGFFVKIPRHRLMVAEEEPPEVDADGKPKVKRARKPRKSHLEDAYPAVIQEGFFGIRPVDGKNLLDAELAEPSLFEMSTRRTTQMPRNDELSQQASEALRNDIDESGVLDGVNINDFMDIDNLNFDIFEDDEEFDTSLNDAFDIVQSDGFDMSRSNSTAPNQEGTDGGHTSSSHTVHPQQGHTMQMGHPIHPHHALGQQHPHMTHPHHPQGHPGMMSGESSSGQMSRSNSQMEGGTEGKTSSNNAATERWEEDEPLGDKATKAAVLYVNVNHPTLREQYPDWNERVKHIHRIWRGLAADARQEYVTRARFNRAQREKVPRPRGPRNPTAAAAQAKLGGTANGEQTTGAALAMRMGMTNGGMGQGPMGGNSAIGGQMGTTVGGGTPFHGSALSMGEQFKVPAVPSQGPPQPPSIDHLPLDIQNEYHTIRRIAKDLNIKQEQCENDINKQRKQKKNLVAKRRQIVKSSGEAEGAGLNEADSNQLAALTVGISDQVKLLEQYKRDVKTHMTAVHEFEAKHRIQTEGAMALMAAGMGGPSGNGMGGGPMGTPHMAIPHGMARQTMMTQGGGGPSGPYQQLVVPQQVPFSQMLAAQQERGFPLGAVPPNALRGPMRTPMSFPPRWNVPRNPVLGGLPFASIQNADDRDVYDCLDHVIERISIDADGPSAITLSGPSHMHPMGPHMSGGPMGGGPSLKRLLEPGPSSISLMMEEQPKPKKKRQMQKKTGTTGTNDYEVALDRLKSALLNCERLPKKALEPSPRNEPALFAFMGMGLSDLGEKFEKEKPQEVPFGQLKLTFADDIYADVKKVSLPLPVSMSSLVPKAKLSVLQLMAASSSSFCPSPPGLVKDEQDSSCPSTSQCVTPCGDVLRSLVCGLEKRRPLLRCSSKIAETGLPPSEPHRIAFHQTVKEEEEEVEICLELIDKKGMNGEMCERDMVARQLLQKLQEMLDVKRPIDDFHLDTPPASPSEAAVHLDVKPDPSTLGYPLSNVHAAAPIANGSSSSSAPVTGCSAPSMIPSAPVPSGACAKCRLCDREMLAANSVRQSMSQLGLTPSDDGKDDTVSFCSMKCYYMFVASSKVALSPEQLARAEAHVDETTYTKLKQISADSFARCIHQGRMKQEPRSLPPAPIHPTALSIAHLDRHSMSTSGSVPPTPTTAGSAELDLKSPKDTRYVMDEGRRDNFHVIRCIDLGQLVDPNKKDGGGRSTGEDWKKYDQSLLNSFLRIHQQKQELAMMPKMGVEFTRMVDDMRRCILCGITGDGDSTNAGRLLNYEAGSWIHVNCALWSSEVYETPSGALLNVDRAVIRGSTSQCKLCGGVGATVQCFKADCLKTFHLPCANRMFGKFLRDKTFMCPTHYDIHVDAVAPIDPLRRLYIDRDENKLLARLFETPDPPAKNYVLHLGAFTFHKLGQLLPDQLKTCHNSRYIFPIGYKVTRFFWSPIDARRRVKFSLNITEREGLPVFHVSCMDPSLIENGRKTHWAGESASIAWKEVLDDIVKLRSRSDLLQFLPTQIEAETLFGLAETTVTKMTESLPGVDSLYAYSFRHGGVPVLELPLAENPSGAARCEPRMKTLIKHRKQVHSSGRSLGGAGSSGSGKRGSLYEELQMMMRVSGYKGDFSNGGRWDTYGSTEQSFSAYQKMRKEWRNTVNLARSKIQGLGLYAKRDIDMGSMIIEYKGEVIRAEVGEMREKRYFAQNRGTYMFKAADEMIIDATMKGGPARYINHSCDPNCATHIMHMGANGEDKKIIITANRPIKCGEELTYDYQFDIEDDTDKVACLCGAPNCQRWMN